MSNSSRSVWSADRALVWAHSGGVCCFPECDVMCVQESDGADPAAVIGHIAHIEAHSDRGPRGNPTLTERQRNEYSNLILLCPTHHRLVDTFTSTYTADELRGWKADRETRFLEALTHGMGTVTFHELDLVTQALVNSGGVPSISFTIVPLAEKMARNGLSAQTRGLFSIGLLQSGQVQQYVEAMSSIDRSFVDRLTSGFVNEYHQRRLAGLEGDSLFEEMRMFSAQGNLEIRNQCAGLAVLVYLFERCEVFEQ